MLGGVLWSSNSRIGTKIDPNITDIGKAFGAKWRYLLLECDMRFFGDDFAMEFCWKLKKKKTHCSED